MLLYGAFYNEMMPPVIRNGPSSKNLVLPPYQSAGASGIRFNVLASRPGRPQLPNEGASLAVVVIADYGFDRLGGLLGVVKGNTAGNGLARPKQRNEL